MIYLFEDYSFDTARRELRRGANFVAIEPQVFDLLQLFIRERTRVVSKDDLIAKVWNGRIVSESTLTSRITAARHAVGDSGEKQRLIRTVPRKGHRFVGEVREHERSPDGCTAKPAASVVPLDQVGQLRPALTLPNRPSIAVLPFNNMSGDPEQEYFADGMVEEIITALSRVRWLFVIARNSSFTYKGRATDVKQVGRELGVRYVLEGGVRKAVRRVRITAQLIDASTGAHLWADRFEGTLKDIFDLQDQVTASVVGAIAPKLEQAEIVRTKNKPTESLDAYDYYLRGIATVHQLNSKANDEALRLFYTAIDLDPDFAPAYGMAAQCFHWRKRYGLMSDRVREIAETERLGRRAAELGREDAVALCNGGHALAFVVGDLDMAAELIDRARVLNPNLAAAWRFSGWLKVYLGEPHVAIEHLARAMRLSPFDPLISDMQRATSFAHLIAAQYDEATSWAEKALREQPNDVTSMRMVAASYALSGRLEEARNAMSRMRERDPSLRVSNLKDLAPLRRPEDFARWAEGLRMAGLPE